MSDVYPENMKSYTPPLPSSRGSLRLGARLLSKSRSKWIQAKSCPQVRPVLLEGERESEREERKSNLKQTPRNVNVVIDISSIFALFMANDDGGNVKW